MSKEELLQALSMLNVSPETYSLEGKLIEGIVVDITVNYYDGNKSYKEWRVFEQERGSRYNENVFYSEAEAFDDVYKRLKD